MRRTLHYATRLWFYFRIGYATYLTFILGALSTLVVVWYLAIREAPAIESFFGRFVPFAIVAALVGVPLSVGIGWVHLKRSPAYSSEQDISVEASPWYYKLAPGWQREAFAPVYLELLTQLSRLLDANNLLTE